MSLNQMYSQHIQATDTIAIIFWLIMSFAVGLCVGVWVW